MNWVGGGEEGVDEGEAFGVWGGVLEGAGYWIGGGVGVEGGVGVVV